MNIRSITRGLAPGRWTGELTGRRVFLLLLGFFLLIFAVNGAFLYLALSSHPGTTARDAYREGLEYNRLLERAERQRALGWRARILEESGTVRLRLLDAAGAAVTGLAGTVHAGRPATDSEDRILPAMETAPGVYRVEGPPFAPGRWTIVFEMRTGDGRRFRAENDITVRR